MLGDPKECRQHALQCALLAQRAISTTEREAFGKLAHTWIQLATDLEHTQALQMRRVGYRGARGRMGPNPHRSLPLNAPPWRQSLPTDRLVQTLQA
jgi:hypothetical protein